MRTNRRIHPYIPPDQLKRLRALSAAENVTQSALVQAAIQDYLDRDAKDNALIIKRLDRNARALMRLQRDQEAHAEAFASFVNWWCGYLPERSDADRVAADRIGRRRYSQFVEGVARTLAEGQTFVREVVKDLPPANDQAAVDAGVEGQRA